MINKKPPAEVLEDFLRDSELYEAGESTKIAENTDFGVEIWLTGEVRYGNSVFPVITVLADDDMMYDQCAYTKEEFLTMLGEVYDDYLTMNIIDIAAAEVKPEEKPEEKDEPVILDESDIEEDEIKEQEKRLDDAVLAFLNEAYGFDPLEKDEKAEEKLEALKEAFCVACAEHVDGGVYRPCYVQNDKDEWVFERYPYEFTEISVE